MWKCSRCETVNAEGSYCEICGAKRGNTTQNRAGGYTTRDFDDRGNGSKKTNQNNVLIAIVVVLAVVLIGAMGVLAGVVLGGDTKQAKEPTYSVPADSVIVSSEPEGLLDDEDDNYHIDETEDADEIPYLNPEEENAKTPKPKTATPKKTSAPKVTPEVFYRVRKSPNDAKSQKGAFKVLQNAINEANKYKSQGYEVYDMNGNLVYAP